MQQLEHCPSGDVEALDKDRAIDLRKYVGRPAVNDIRPCVIEFLDALLDSFPALRVRSKIRGTLFCNSREILPLGRSYILSNAIATSTILTSSANPLSLASASESRPTIGATLAYLSPFRFSKASVAWASAPAPVPDTRQTDRTFQRNGGRVRYRDNSPDRGAGWRTGRCNGLTLQWIASAPRAPQQEVPGRSARPGKTTLYFSVLTPRDSRFGATPASTGTV